MNPLAPGGIRTSEAAPIRGLGSSSSSSSSSNFGGYSGLPGNSGMRGGFRGSSFAPSRPPATPSSMLVSSQSSMAPAMLSEEDRKRIFVNHQRTLSDEKRRMESLPMVYPDKMILRVMSQKKLIANSVLSVSVTLAQARQDKINGGTDIGTVADTVLGNPDIRSPCGYVECRKIGCPGHVGIIPLEPHQYIFVPFCINTVAALMNCFCMNCYNLFSPQLPSDIQALPPDKRLAKAAKKLESMECRTPVLSKNQIQCPPRRHYFVEKAPEGYYILVSAKTKSGDKGNQERQEVSPAEALGSLSQLNKEGLKVLGFTFDGDHPITDPVDFVMTSIPVMQYPCRAPTIQKGMTNHCYLTKKLDDIVAFVTSDKGTKNTASSKDVQKPYLALIHGETTTSKTQKTKKQQGIFNLTQGKKSVIRGSMMGKRNEGTARGVASSAPVRHGTIGVPLPVSRVFSQPLRVTTYNKKYCESLFDKGLVDYYCPRSTGVLYDCAASKKLRDEKGNVLPSKKYTLYVGDVIGKFIEEGDWVFDNRHPTLSKPSMQAHRVVYGKNFEERRGVTINHHGSDCPPSNMDFDGDDKNLGCPISVYARAEAAYLLHVPNIIMSDSQNRPNTGLIVNSVLASYLLTYREQIIGETLFRRLLNMITCRDGFDTLFDRLSYHGVHPRSGAAIYSALLPPDLHVNTLRIDDDGKEKGVVICFGIIVRGTLDKSLVGPAHRSLIQEIYKKYGAKRTSLFLTDAVYVCNKWIGEYGFSCGISDFIATDTAKMNKNIDDEIRSVSVLIESLGGPVPDPQQEEYRLKKKSEYFDVTKGLGVKLTKTFVLDVDGNRLGIMHKDRSGVKGDTYNLNQLLGVGGIKKYDGKFLTRGARDGTASLPQFVAGSLDMAMDGFVKGNYQKGYEPSEVFYDAKGGRSSVINTNVDTAVTGYMQRKVGKITEGITVGPKGDAVNTNGVNFGPVANCGYAINMLMNVEHPHKGTVTFPFDVRQITDTVNLSYGYYPKNVAEIIEQNRAIDETRTPLPPIVLTAPKKEFGRKYVGVPGLHRHTRFERTAIIARRADEIENNCQVRLKGDQLFGRKFEDENVREQIFDPVRIAAKEYRLGLLSDMMALRSNGDFNIPAKPEFLNIH